MRNGEEDAGGRPAENAGEEGAKRPPVRADPGDEERGPGRRTGEAAGSVTGTLGGAVLGSAAGPLGAIIGGVAGAAGGWWAGRAVADAASGFSAEEEHYRAHHEAMIAEGESPEYERVRAAYGLGHIAGRNPGYRGRPYDEIEEEIRGGWNEEYGAYEEMRPFVRHGYRRSATLGDPADPPDHPRERPVDRGAAGPRYTEL